MHLVQHGCSLRLFVALPLLAQQLACLLHEGLHHRLQSFLCLLHHAVHIEWQVLQQARLLCKVQGHCRQQHQEGQGNEAAKAAAVLAAAPEHRGVCGPVGPGILRSTEGKVQPNKSACTVSGRVSVCFGGKHKHRCVPVARADFCSCRR